MFWNKNKIPDLKLEDIDDEKDLFRPDLEEYLDEEEVSDIPYDEKEIKKEEVEDDKNSLNNHSSIKIVNKVVNIILILLIVSGIFVCTDIICVSRFNVGPFFAIRTKIYNDGGTKEYKGLFYKVIKYNEKNGRVDTVVGPWSLEYSVKYKEMDMLDLALDFNNNLNDSIDKNMNRYLKVEGEIMDINDKSIILKYIDKDKKYNTTLKCNLLKNNKKYKKKDKVEIVGTLYNYSKKDELILAMKNCYIK